MKRFYIPFILAYAISALSCHDSPKNETGYALETKDSSSDSTKVSIISNDLKDSIPLCKLKIVSLEMRYDADYNQKIYCTIQNNDGNISSLRFVLDFRGYQGIGNKTAFVEPGNPCVLIKIWKGEIKAGETKTVVLDAPKGDSCPHENYHIALWDYITDSGTIKTGPFNVAEFMNYCKLFK